MKSKIFSNFRYSLLWKTTKITKGLHNIPQNVSWNIYYNFAALESALFRYSREIFSLLGRLMLYK